MLLTALLAVGGTASEAGREGRMGASEEVNGAPGVAAAGCVWEAGGNGAILYWNILALS